VVYLHTAVTASGGCAVLDLPLPAVGVLAVRGAGKSMHVELGAARQLLHTLHTFDASHERVSRWYNSMWASGPAAADAPLLAAHSSRVHCGGGSDHEDGHQAAPHHAAAGGSKPALSPDGTDLMVAVQMLALLSLNWRQEVWPWAERAVMAAAAGGGGSSSSSDHHPGLGLLPTALPAGAIAARKPSQPG
jgi:hypothetical protein